jgi:8-oxo-dGTP pyrophosphatase MutT (NUDIX family)
MKGDRVTAIIIKDKKLLLVTGYDETKWWTPGGGLEDETHEEGMARELDEEIGVGLKSMKLLFEYKSFHRFRKINQTVYCYLVDIEGEINCGEEVTKSGWFSKEELKDLKLFSEDCINQVIELGLL